MYLVSPVYGLFSYLKSHFSYMCFTQCSRNVTKHVHCVIFDTSVPYHCVHPCELSALLPSIIVPTSCNGHNNTFQHQSGDTGVLCRFQHLKT